MNSLVSLFIACLFLMPSIANAFCYEEAGNTYGINPSLIESIAEIESSSNPQAINRNQDGSIDMGLMQVNSSWITTLGLDSGRLLSDPCYNVRAGARILKYCIVKHGYTWEAVGCYNAASKHKRVGYSWKVYNKLKAEKSNSPSPPFAKGVITNPKSRTPNSSLFFSVRDNAVVE